VASEARFDKESSRWLALVDGRTVCPGLPPEVAFLVRPLSPSRVAEKELTGAVTLTFTHRHHAHSQERGA